MTSDGFRNLAAAVLMQAVAELHGAPAADTPPKHRGRLRREALAFLRPDDTDLQWWCDALDLEPEGFCEAARTNGRLIREMAERAERRERRQA